MKLDGTNSDSGMMTSLINVSDGPSNPFPQEFMFYDAGTVELGTDLQEDDDGVSDLENEDDDDL